MVPRIRRHQKRFQKLFHKRQSNARNQMFILSKLCRDPRFFPYRNHYTKLIKTIGMKAQQPIPRELKITFCRSCLTFFTLEPETTVRIRTRSKPTPHIIYTCLKCGKIRRQPFPRRYKPWRRDGSGRPSNRWR
ncbi:MAG: hypothetical protein ACFFD1_13920, partial [Candidatus Thorarchaeota archaeon]